MTAIGADNNNDWWLLSCWWSCDGEAWLWWLGSDTVVAFVFLQLCQLYFSKCINCISPTVPIVFLQWLVIIIMLMFLWCWSLALVAWRWLYFSYCVNCISLNVSIIFLSFDGVSGPGQLCELVRCILGWVNDGSCHSRAPPLAAPTPDCAPDRNHPPAPDPGGKCHHRLLLAAVILGGCQPCDPSKLLHAAVTVAKKSIALHWCNIDPGESCSQMCTAAVLSTVPNSGNEWHHMHKEHQRFAESVTNSPNVFLDIRNDAESRSDLGGRQLLNILVLTTIHDVLRHHLHHHQTPDTRQKGDQKVSSLTIPIQVVSHHWCLTLSSDSPPAPYVSCAHLHSHSLFFLWWRS